MYQDKDALVILQKGILKAEKVWVTGGCAIVIEIRYFVGSARHHLQFVRSVSKERHRYLK